MSIINLRGNTVAPHDHLSRTNDQDEDGVEDWLSQLLNQRAFNSHSHPAQVSVTKSFPAGIAANALTQILAAGLLKKYQAYALKILIECGSQPPYSGAIGLQFVATNCNNTTTTMQVTPMWHTGSGTNVNITFLGGIQTTPSVNLRLPIALPPNSTITAEFLELF